MGQGLGEAGRGRLSDLGGGDCRGRPAAVPRHCSGGCPGYGVGREGQAWGTSEGKVALL